MEQQGRFAEVAVAAGRHGSRETYTYSIPDGLQPVVGQQVWVPFGRRDEHGYVVALRAQTELSEVKALKSVDKAPPLFAYQVELAKLMRDRYWATLGECLQIMMPPRIRFGGVPVNGKQQRKFSGILKALKATVGYNPAFSLSEAQEAALSSFRAHQRLLLLGVTGSGKTEVYLRAAAETVEKGQSVLVLSPEAAPTPQLLERFAARFPGQVAVLSSGLTDLERAQEWARVRNGGAKIVIGNRSAIFAPMSNLGLICIDEEGSSSYQEERRPRYNVTGVAWDLASVTRAKLILGSATPSLSSYQAALDGKLEIAKLPERIQGQAANVRLVDMRSERASGVRGPLARSLESALNAALAAHSQTLLLQNRKYVSYALCGACGKALSCPNCSVSMVQDSDKEGLVCVYCGHKEDLPLLCPTCHKPKMAWASRGQKLDVWLNKKWPQARVVSHSGEGDLDAHQAVYAAMTKREVDVLVGTQSLGHGFDLTGVNLVGILDADRALNAARYDSAETCFDFVLQAAGRAGRGKETATVLVQTVRPEHYSLQYAAKNDYEGFAKEELSLRSILGYPPFAELATLTYGHKNAEKAEKESLRLEAKLQVEMVRQGITDIEILGPAKAATEKLRGEYRWQLSLKGQNLGRLRSLLAAEHAWQIELDRRNLD